MEISSPSTSAVNRSRKTPSSATIPEAIQVPVLISNDVKDHDDHALLGHRLKCLKSSVYSINMRHRLLLGFFLTMGILSLLLFELGVFSTVNQQNFSLDVPMLTTHFVPPYYFSIVTLNLGEPEHVVNNEALRQFASNFQPDFLAVQEPGSNEPLEILDSALATHQRVIFSTNPTKVHHSKYTQWSTEGTIYYNQNTWNLTEHGCVQFGEHEDRKATRNLFWMRFSVVSEANGSIDPNVYSNSILVASVKLTAAGSEAEINSARNPRIQEGDAIMDILAKVRKEPSEALILVGDMGDGYSAQSLFTPAGLNDPFTSLSLPMEATFPSRRTKDRGIVQSSSVRDWIFSNDRIRAVSASILRFEYNHDTVSCHWPVMGVYELLMCDPSCRAFRKTRNQLNLRKSKGSGK